MESAAISEPGMLYDLRPVRWGRAVGAGLATGAIFLLLSRGLPWVSSGMVSFTLMGRELKSPAVLNEGLDFSIAGLHILCSVIYALIIIPIIHRLHPPAAMVTGALLGIALYFLSRALFTQVLAVGLPNNELNPFITHLAFGVIVAGFYKGLARRRVPVAG